MSPFRHKVRTCLWFEKNGLQAARFYVSLLPGSTIDSIHEQGNAADPRVVEYTLHGAPMMHLSAGPHVKPNAAASISVLTKDQAETDSLWAALVSGGGAPGRCGWLTDRYGISWQIVPEALPRLLELPDPQTTARVLSAMMSMHKIDIAALEAAAAG